MTWRNGMEERVDRKQRKERKERRKKGGTGEENRNEEE
jgi:hypothetical protein